MLGLWPLLKSKVVERDTLEREPVQFSLMILVDDARGKWPMISHVPWNGCNLADFVMPFFLFIVGMAISLALKRIPNLHVAAIKVIFRTFKLLLRGILLQGWFIRSFSNGGYSHAPNKLTYGVDMKKVRWCGILQVLQPGGVCGRWLPHAGQWLAMGAVSLSEQVEHYKDYQKKLAQIAGPKNSTSIISGGIYLISAGSSEFIQNFYIDPLLKNIYTPKVFSNVLVQEFAYFVQNLYDLGARKVGVTSLPPMGCVPTAINIFGDGSDKCVEFLNKDALNSMSSSIL